MEKYSHLLTQYIIAKRIIDKTSYSIYQYGFQIGLEITFSTIISILISAYLHMLPECLLFFILFIPMRSYAGGLHFNKYYACLLCSCITLLGLLLIVKYISIPRMYSLGLTIGILIYIYYIAPVENINRIIDEKEFSYFSQKLNLVLIFIFIIAILFFFLHKDKLLFLVFVTTGLMILSMLLGKIKYRIDLKKYTTDK